MAQSKMNKGCSAIMFPLEEQADAPPM